MIPIGVWGNPAVRYRCARRERTNVESKRWAYCVVGNVVKTRLDAEGNLRHGTIEFSGGTRVYLCGKYWRPGCDTIEAIGLNRFGRFVVGDIPVNAVENLRRKKTYKPHVLSIMDDFEFRDYWWGQSEEDKASADRFVTKWNAKFNVVAKSE